MDSQLDLNRYLGKIVKVVVQETPDAPVEIRKGKLVRFDNNFVEIESYINSFLINRKNIVSLKCFGGSET